MQKGQATREKVKLSSLGLIHQKGYKNTSINHILNAAGIKKGTFYFHYRSKEELAVEVLKEALARYDKKIKAKVKSDSAFEQLFEMIDAIANYHFDGGISKGCIFGNMALEMGKNGSKLSQFVEAVFALWTSRFEVLIDQAVKNREIQLKETSQALARTILAMIEGGLMLSKISGSPEALTDIKQSIVSLLEERKI